jgi:hypothetical protein
MTALRTEHAIGLPTVITVSGPVCTGKTRKVCQIAAALSSSGHKVGIVNREDSHTIIDCWLRGAGADVNNVTQFVSEEQALRFDCDVVVVEQHTTKGGDAS